MRSLSSDAHHKDLLLNGHGQDFWVEKYKIEFLGKLNEHGKKNLMQDRENKATVALFLVYNYLGTRDCEGQDCHFRRLCFDAWRKATGTGNCVCFDDEIAFGAWIRDSIGWFMGKQVDAIRKEKLSRLDVLRVEVEQINAELSALELNACHGGGSERDQV